MKRESTFNFASGPSTLPTSVIEEIRDHLIDHEDYGFSILEVHHRSEAYVKLNQKVHEQLRRILKIPDSHEIALMTGGGVMQFSAAVPTNLMYDPPKENEELKPNKKHGMYIINGGWSQRAFNDAEKLGQVGKYMKPCFETKDYSKIHEQEIIKSVKELKPEETAYVYVCLNETGNGLVMSNELMQKIRNALDKDIPIVADAASCIGIDATTDMKHFGVYFACAQKCIGITGISVVVLEKRIIKNFQGTIPLTLSYYDHVMKKSICNTPATFSIFSMSVMLSWIEEQTVQKVYNNLKERAASIYDALDKSSVLYCPVEKEFRSPFNIVAQLKESSHSVDTLCQRAKDEFALLNIKGHYYAGGFRFANYGAQTTKAVSQLVSFIESLE